MDSSKQFNKVAADYISQFPFNAPRRHLPKPSLRRNETFGGAVVTNEDSPGHCMFPGTDVMSGSPAPVHPEFARKPEGPTVPVHQKLVPIAEVPLPKDDDTPQRLEPAHNLLEQQYGDKVRPYIDLIDSLRLFGVEKDLPLPAIAVIGDQSSGKSSVLEALSGVSLPRGTGIVTRCPLELKLKKNTSSNDWSGTILYGDKKMRIQSPLNVELEVRKAQNAIAGSGNGIKDELITLEIVSPHVPDLTLIDLPGITRIALPNQPLNIGQQIKEIIKKYITRQETITLTVVPSNVDIATTEVLEMAREVDPTGERTIGVLTKPDLVDKGAETEVQRIIQNKVYALKKGYMIVKCRGQSDIQNNLSLEDALKNEKAFFENHKHFSVLLKNRLATIPILAEKLTKELVLHIVKLLPNIDSQIRCKLQDANAKLNVLGKGIPDSDDGRLEFLISKIKNFTDGIAKVVSGEEDGEREDLKLFKNMRNFFSEWETFMKKTNLNYLNELKKDPNIYDNQYRGRELSGFISYGKFEKIMRQQISSFEEFAIGIAHKVSALVQMCLQNESTKCFNQFQNLRIYALTKTEETCQAHQKRATDIIRLQFKMEKNIYCIDSLYCETLSKVQEESSLSNKCSPEQKNQSSLDALSTHLEAYFKETTNRLSNQIPLIIQHFLLHECSSKLQAEMMLLIDNKQQSYLLEEQSDLSEERHQLKCQIQRLQLAHERLTKFQDLKADLHSK